MTEEEKLAELRPRLTPEFMDTLKEALMVCGWGAMDYIEADNFFAWCLQVQGQTVHCGQSYLPEPYDFDEDPES